MTVQPGFGGQPFRTDMLAKLREIDGWRQTRGLKFRLEVDGGIDLTTAPIKPSLPRLWPSCSSRSA